MDLLEQLQAQKIADNEYRIGDKKFVLTTAQSQTWKHEYSQNQGTFRDEEEEKQNEFGTTAQLKKDVSGDLRSGTLVKIQHKTTLQQNILQPKATLQFFAPQSMLGKQQSISSIHAKAQNQQQEISKHGINIASKLQKHLQKIEEASNIIHLAFLFASPLVNHISGDSYYDGIPEIQFRTEIEGILDGVENLKKQFRYRYRLATTKNLRSCLLKDLFGLHFSGHGMPNVVKSFNDKPNEHQKNKDRGDFLLFENENGASFNMYATDLEKMIGHEIVRKPKFVFVASCFSECCGRIFQRAGVEHVICIKSEKQIKDEAAILFSKVFYQEIFSKKSTICQAFWRAREEVRADGNGRYLEEVSKFMLLLHNPKCEEGKRNSDATNGEQCAICNDLDTKIMLSQYIREGTVEFDGIWPKVYKVPSRVEPYLFRSKEMFEVLNLLQKPNVQAVQIISMPGLGKASLIRNVTNHIAERSLYQDGILYLNMNKVSSTEACLEMLCRHLDQPHEKRNFYVRRQSILKSVDESINHFNYVLSGFKKKLLIVLNNIDFIRIKEEEKKFTHAFNSILGENKNVQLLFGSSYCAEKLKNFKIKELEFLSQNKAFELFSQKLQMREFEGDFVSLMMDQLKELHEYSSQLEKEGLPKVTKKPCSLSLHLKNGHTENCLRNYLTTHPLFTKIMGGHPLIISQLASQVSPAICDKKKSLKQLYQSFVESESFSAILKSTKNQEEGGTKTNESRDQMFLDCLDFAFERVGVKSKDLAFRIFYLLGLTYEGLSKQAIAQILDKTEQQIEDRLQALKNYSLLHVEKSPYASNVEIYSVPGFLSAHIDENLHNDSKRMLYQEMIKYYNNKMQEILQGYIDNLEYYRSQEEQQHLVKESDIKKPQVTVSICEFLEQEEMNINLCLEFEKNIKEQNLRKKELKKLKTRFSKSSSANYSHQEAYGQKNEMIEEDEEEDEYMKRNSKANEPSKFKNKVSFKQGKLQTMKSTSTDNYCEDKSSSDNTLTMNKAQALRKQISDSKKLKGLQNQISKMDTLNSVGKQSIMSTKSVKEQFEKEDKVAALMQKAIQMALARNPIQKKEASLLNDLKEIAQDKVQKQQNNIFLEHYQIDANQDDMIDVGPKIGDRKIIIVEDDPIKTLSYSQESTVKMLKKLTCGSRMGAKCRLDQAANDSEATQIQGLSPRGQSKQDTSLISFFSQDELLYLNKLLFIALCNVSGSRNRIMLAQQEESQDNAPLIENYELLEKNYNAFELDLQKLGYRFTHPSVKINVEFLKIYLLLRMENYEEAKMSLETVLGLIRENKEHTYASSIVNYFYAKICSLMGEDQASYAKNAFDANNNFVKINHRLGIQLSKVLIEQCQLNQLPGQKGSAKSLFTQKVLQPPDQLNLGYPQNYLRVHPIPMNYILSQHKVIQLTSLANEPSMNLLITTFGGFGGDRAGNQGMPSRNSTISEEGPTQSNDKTSDEDDALSDVEEEKVEEGYYKGPQVRVHNIENDSILDGERQNEEYKSFPSFTNQSAMERNPTSTKMDEEGRQFRKDESFVIPEVDSEEEGGVSCKLRQAKNNISAKEARKNYGQRRGKLDKNGTSIFGNSKEENCLENENAEYGTLKSGTFYGFATAMPMKELIPKKQTIFKIKHISDDISQNSGHEEAFIVQESFSSSNRSSTLRGDSKVPETNQQLAPLQIWRMPTGNQISIVQDPKLPYIQSQRPSQASQSSVSNQYELKIQNLNIYNSAAPTATNQIRLSSTNNADQDHEIQEQVVFLGEDEESQQQILQPEQSRPHTSNSIRVAKGTANRRLKSRVQESGGSNFITAQRDKSATTTKFLKKKVIENEGRSSQKYTHGTLTDLLFDGVKQPQGIRIPENHEYSDLKASLKYSLVRNKQKKHRERSQPKKELAISQEIKELIEESLPKQEQLSYFRHSPVSFKQQSPQGIVQNKKKKYQQNRSSSHYQQNTFKQYATTNDYHSALSKYQQQLQGGIISSPKVINILTSPTNSMISRQQSHQSNYASSIQSPTASPNDQINGSGGGGAGIYLPNVSQPLFEIQPLNNVIRLTNKQLQSLSLQQQPIIANYNNKFHAAATQHQQIQDIIRGPQLQAFQKHQTMNQSAYGQMSQFSSVVQENSQNVSIDNFSNFHDDYLTKMAIINPIQQQQQVITAPQNMQQRPKTSFENQIIRNSAQSNQQQQYLQSPGTPVAPIKANVKNSPSSTRPLSQVQQEEMMLSSSNTFNPSQRGNPQIQLRKVLQLNPASATFVINSNNVNAQQDLSFLQTKSITLQNKAEGSSPQTKLRGRPTFGSRK